MAAVNSSGRGAETGLVLPGAESRPWRRAPPEHLAEDDGDGVPDLPELARPAADDLPRPGEALEGGTLAPGQAAQRAVRRTNPILARRAGDRPGRQRQVGD